jgi:hypothetical protein
MNATTLALPSWTADIQHYSQKVMFYTPIVWRSFQRNIAPVLVESVKGLSLHWFESECYWRQRILNLAGITHNPLTEAVSAAIAELTSAEAQATYRRINHIIRETATDALVIGLCGVVAIVSGIEFGQKVYRQVKTAYAWVDAKLNPVGPGPMILPTVEMAIAPHQESTLQQEPLADIQALIAEDEEYERQFMAKLERLDDVKDCADEIQPQTENNLWDGEVDYEPVEFSPSSEFVPMSDSVPALAPVCVPVIAEIANPEPHDIHQEVEERLREIHAIAPTEDPAPKVEAPAEDLASALHVPGAEGTPKRTRGRKPKQNEGEAEAKASASKCKGRTASKK